MIVVAGSLNIDLIGRVPRLPAPGETVLGGELLRLHGGKGGNQAVAAARLGARVAFAGATGADAFGAELLQGLRDEGIDTAQTIQVAGATSGCALISAADGGANAICVLPGANLQAPLPPRLWPAAWRLLVLQLEIPIATASAWAQAARLAGAQVVLNAAPMQPLPAELLAAVQTLVVNEVELAALAGPVAATGLPAALAAVSARGPVRVVATLGAHGVMAHDAGRTLALPGHRIDVVDTTGAGDSFIGALAAALAGSAGLHAALTRVNAAAALSCTRLGAREGMPTAAQLDAWLASRPG